LPDDEIGTLNIREYEALIKRKEAADNRMRLNFGIVASIVANSAPFGDPNRTPLQPDDFLPESARAAAIDLTKMEPVEQLNYFMNLFSKRTMRKK
jgi:hypothetical protein